MHDDELDSLEELEQEVFLRCPFCAAEISVLVEMTAPEQDYVEDCEVCCRPMALHVWRDGGRVRVEAQGGA